MERQSVFIVVRGSNELKSRMWLPLTHDRRVASQATISTLSP